MCLISSGCALGFGHCRCLQFDEFSVVSIAFCHELFRATLLKDLAFVEKDYVIGLSDRRKPMCNDDDESVLRSFVECSH